MQCEALRMDGTWTIERDGTRIAPSGGECIRTRMQNIERTEHQTMQNGKKFIKGHQFVGVANTKGYDWSCIQWCHIYSLEGKPPHPS